MITFDLSEDLQLVRRTAEELAAQEIRPKGRDAESAQAVPEALDRRVAELGFCGLDIPEREGGLELGMIGRVVVEEALAHGDIGIALGLASGSFVQAVLALGTEAQRAALLEPVVQGSGRGALAWSEPRPRPGTFSTIADQTADETWRIRGIKSEIVSGRRADRFVVFAEARPLEGRAEPAAFVVDARARGVRVSDPEGGLGLLAAAPVGLTLEDVIVEDAARLSGAGDRFESAVVEMFARIGLAGAGRAVGLASAAFELAQAWAAERKAFGKPIAHFQGLAFLIADMATQVEVMRGLVHRAAWALDESQPDAVKLAAMAIAECHEGAMFVSNNTVQVLGGSGYIQDYPAEKWMRDAKAHMAYAMPHQLCDLLVGRLAIDGGALSMAHDAPMPQLQPVLV